MRRRLLIGTVAIAVLCVVILGVPLILLARHEVWTSARDRLNEQAASAAVDVEDRVELNRPLDLRPLQKLMPHRRLTVITPTGRLVTAAGVRIDHALTARAVAADYTVIVQAPQGPVVTRAREITVLLLALGAAAIAAAVALAQVERLNRVITAFLARARGDAAPPEAVDLSALVADCCSPYARLLRRADRRLHTAITPGISVCVRSEHVLAALGCLLDNALVHGAGTVSVVTRRHSHSVDVAVTDEGAGVPDDLRDSIFERLISGARSSGIGLGLARALTTTERGTLRLEPPATFVLTLPIEEPAGPTATPD